MQKRSHPRTRRALNWPFNQSSARGANIILLSFFMLPLPLTVLGTLRAARIYLAQISENGLNGKDPPSTNMSNNDFSGRGTKRRVRIKYSRIILQLMPIRTDNPLKQLKLSLRCSANGDMVGGVTKGPLHKLQYRAILPNRRDSSIIMDIMDHFVHPTAKLSLNPTSKRK
jgi:hypothetical protein